MKFDFRLVNALPSIIIKEASGACPKHTTGRLKTMNLKPCCLSNDTGYEEMDLPSSSRSAENE